MNNKGFTLIEVLAVLVILSAIMGIALPAFSSSMEKSKEKQEQLYVERIKYAAELYVADYKFDVIYKTAGNEYFISAGELLEKEYLSLSDVKNNSDGVIYNKSTHEYTFSGS